MRSLSTHLHPTLPIRINVIAPSWTDTSLVDPGVIAAIGQDKFQSADAPARSATLLMADRQRHGELVYSKCGNFKDLENGENGYHHLTAVMLGLSNEEELGELKLTREVAARLSAGG